MRYVLNSFLIFGFLFNMSCNSNQYQSANDQHEQVMKVVDKFYSRNNDFQTLEDAWGPYTLDLGFEAMLAYDRAVGENLFLDSVKLIMERRNLKPTDTISYKKQPFGNLYFALFMATGDSSYEPPFIYETKKMVSEAKFHENVGVLHGFKEKDGLLIDYVQEFASRMAKTGYVTGNDKWFEQAVKQFEIYHESVRQPETGLYTQGKGFFADPDSLSPGVWSRGQGWILRGMVSTMIYLPENSEYMERMGVILEEYASDLLKRQNSSGMWHQLVDHPFDESYPETSGTAFIAWYLALAVDNGFLPEKPYGEAALKAIEAVKQQITPEGDILNGCPGPGPITSLDGYYKTPGVINEPHLFGTVIFALAGEKLLVDQPD